MLGRWQRKNDALHSQRGSRPFFTPNKASIEKASKGSFNNYVGWFKNPVSSLTKKIIACPKFSDDLGLNQNILGLPSIFQFERTVRDLKIPKLMGPNFTQSLLCILVHVVIECSPKPLRKKMRSKSDRLMGILKMQAQSPETPDHKTSPQRAVERLK